MKLRASRWVKRECQGKIYTFSCGSDSKMSTIVSSCSLASAEFRFSGLLQRSWRTATGGTRRIIGGEKLHCSTRVRRSSSAATDCTGIRTVLKPRKPHFTLMYSGSPLPFRKISSVRPTLCPWGSHTIYPAYSSAVRTGPPRSLWPTAAYSLCMGNFLSSSLLPRHESCSPRRSLTEARVRLSR